MEQPNIEHIGARDYCMRLGLKAALLWSISFLLNMYSPNFPLLWSLSLFVGLYSIVAIGKSLRLYRNFIAPTMGFGSIWIMALQTFFYATLCTTLVQYIYFRFLDNGMLLEQWKMIIEIPEYKKLLNGYDMNAFMDVLKRPWQLTSVLFIYNNLLGLMLSFPTAGLGMMGRPKES